MAYPKHITIGILLWAIFVPYLQAQQPPSKWVEQIEQWIESTGDEAPANYEELGEIYETLVETPINLNDTTSSRLTQLHLIDNYRWRILKAYIEMYGQLYSVDELYLVNLFDRELIEMMRPIVTAQPVEPPDTLSLRRLLALGRHKITLGAGSSFEQARGFSEGHYEGSPLKLYTRYDYRYRDRIRLSISAKKDPGEALFSGSQQRGFDFYSAFVELRNIGLVRQAIAGRYHLQWGQGLTLWTGFAPYGIDDISVGRQARGICNASAYTEYGYLQGVAATLSVFRNTELSLFYSNAARDATRNNDGQIVSLSNSGLHRTTTEIAKRNALREQLYGLHLQYDNGRLLLGATLCHTLLSDSLHPRQYVYNYHAFSSNQNLNAGIDFNYQYRRLSLFGEGTLSLNGAPAGIAGVSMRIGESDIVCLSARHYDVDHQNLHAAPMARTSGVSNEQAVNLSYQTVLPLSVKALVEADLYRSPSLRYGVYAPSSGAYLRLRLSQQLTQHCLIKINYLSHSKPHNASNIPTTTYLTEQTLRRQLSASIQYELGPLRLRTHLANCWYSSELSSSSNGFLIYEDLNYSAPSIPLQLSTRFALFDIDNYNARLFAAESDIAYQIATTSYYGQGFRFYLVARYVIASSIQITAKYAITTRVNASSIGSGYDQTPGDHRQQWKLQLDWKF